jgi:hypothetical protein
MPSLRPFAIPLLLASTAIAQIPAGHYVVSSLRTSASGTGGLTIVHPTGAVAPQPITGLPPELVGAGSANTSGANSVLDAKDGFLLAGNLSSTGTPVNLYELVVVNGAVVFSQTTNVGIGGNRAESPTVNQMALLANGNVVFAALNIDPAGPLGGQSIGLWDRSTATVTGIPIPMPTGWINGLTVDEANSTIYFGMWSANDIYSAPITGGNPTLVTSVPGNFWNLARDQDGNLLAAAGSNLYRIDPQTGQTLETIPSGAGNLLGVSIERPTADPIGCAGNSAGGQVVRLQASGAQTIGPITGLVSGITVVDSVLEYGTATPGSTDYAFRTFPGVGGLPVAGNANHAVQIDAANGNTNLGVLAANFGSASLPLLGFQLLVDPAGAVALGPFPAGSPIPFALPPGLPQTSVFLQSIHLDAGAPQGFAASRGLNLTTIE